MNFQYYYELISSLGILYPSYYSIHVFPVFYCIWPVLLPEPAYCARYNATVLYLH